MGSLERMNLARVMATIGMLGTMALLSGLVVARGSGALRPPGQDLAILDSLRMALRNAPDGRPLVMLYDVNSSEQLTSILHAIRVAYAERGQLASAARKSRAEFFVAMVPAVGAAGPLRQRVHRPVETDGASALACPPAPATTLSGAELEALLEHVLPSGSDAIPGPSGPVRIAVIVTRSDSAAAQFSSARPVEGHWSGPLTDFEMIVGPTAGTPEPAMPRMP